MKVVDGSIRGAVVDPEGAVIGNAYVLIRTDALDREHPTAYSRELRTNKNGEFIASLAAGFYDMFIGASGFTPHCQKVRIREGQLQMIEISMKVDSLMTKEYADDFLTTPPKKTQPLTPQDDLYPRLRKAQNYAAEGFEPLDCFAGQVRVQRKRLSRQSFTVFRPNTDMKCCGEKIAAGRTDAHGHFLVEPLSEGEYFTVFDSKGTKYAMNFSVLQAYQRCDGSHVEINFSTVYQSSLQRYIDVDYSEKDCSEDDAGCYRK
jgi:hypothetical protein